MKEKWRPRLGLVVLAILLTMLALPLASLFFFRFYENQLIRQTEAELIAQGAAVGAVFARDVREWQGPALPLGALVPADATGSPADRFHAIEPRLDLAVGPILPTRARSDVEAAPSPAAALGARMQSILFETQRSTLAGFRLLDAQGVVIAGEAELGLSLSGVEEVRTALSGRYASALRRRVSDQADPALYSVSRGTRIRVTVAMPIIVDARVAGVIYLWRTPNNIVRHLYGERGKLALAGLTVAGMTLLIAFVFMRTISRPMHELQRRTARIAAGDASALAPLTHHGTREMAELSAAFLDMARKLHTRSDAIRTFATHLSHELKSPLTAIQGAAELLREENGTMESAVKARFYGNIIADTHRLNHLVRRLIELTRAENADPTGETASLADGLATLRLEKRLDVAVEIEGAGTRLRISAEKLGIVLSNLVENSMAHGASRILLKAAETSTHATITASDDGSGISPANRPRVFEPFFTTRRDSGGTGLGLGIVKALLQAHDGTIQLVDTDRGTCFAIRLPLA